MKTQEELNALKEEVETVSRKPHELTEEELEQVVGGAGPDESCIDPSSLLKEPENAEAGEGLQQDME